jgi:hypothetical protein
MVLVNNRLDGDYPHGMHMVQKGMDLLLGSTFILVNTGLWIGNLLKYNHLIVKLKRF